MYYVTETWLHDGIPDNMIAIPNYQLFRNDRSYSRGGGTCIFVHKRLYFEIYENKLNEKNIEIQGIRLTGNTLNNRCKHIDVVCVYRPPNGNSKCANEQIVRFCENIPKPRVTINR